jgi:spermidine/putrescine transport system permease protein
MNPTKLLTNLYCWGILLFLFAPTLAIILFSFDASGTGIFPPHSFSFRWYREAVSDPVITSAFWNSVIVGVAAVVIAIVVGTLAAFAFHSRRTRASGVVMGLVVLPLALPPLVLGISLLSLFNALNIRLSLMTVTIGHLVLVIPVVLLTLVARLSNFDDSLIEAARDLGASPWTTFRRVTLPLIRPSMIGAALLVLAISLDEFIVSSFTIGTQNTVPIVIFGQMRRGVSPAVNAISVVLLTITLILVAVTRRVSGTTLSPGEKT